MLPRSLAIVGVGLIGGSVGLAVRRGGGTHVVGFDRNAEGVRLARERGLVDETRADLEAAVAAADMVLFCTPVDVVATQALAAAPACRAGTILTDAGSTKGGIVRALEGRLPP